MVLATFADSSVRTVKGVVEADSKTLKVLLDKTTVGVLPTDSKFSSTEAVSYAYAKPVKSLQKTAVEELLPFRVKFTTTSLSGWSKSNPAPIGIATIGVNNYIL
jgi:hypothetical protein